MTIRWIQINGNDSKYSSSLYKDEYEQDDVKWLGIATGNLIFNHMISYDQVYESILIDYFSQFNESQENNSNLDILLEEIKSANTRYKNIKIVEKTAEYVNNLRDLKLTKSFVYQLVRSHKYVKTDTIINLIKNIQIQSMI